MFSKLFKIVLPLVVGLGALCYFYAPARLAAIRGDGTESGLPLLDSDPQRR